MLNLSQSTGPPPRSGIRETFRPAGLSWIYAYTWDLGVPTFCGLEAYSDFLLIFRSVFVRTITSSMASFFFPPLRLVALCPCFSSRSPRPAKLNIILHFESPQSDEFGERLYTFPRFFTPCDAFLYFAHRRPGSRPRFSIVFRPFSYRQKVTRLDRPAPLSKDLITDS